MKDTSIPGHIISSLARQPDPRIKDVHTEHCCALHGCKYNNAYCTVTMAKAAQSYPCEGCLDEWDELYDWAHLMNEMYNRGYNEGYELCTRTFLSIR